MFKKWKKRNTVLLVCFLVWNVFMFDKGIFSVAVPFIQKDLGFTELQLGLLMSAFSIGYVINQIPGGAFSDRFGPRRFMTLGVVLWSIFGSIFGFLSNFIPMLVFRVLFGAGEALMPGSYFKVIGNWFPQKERGQATSAMFISQYTGGILSVIVGGAIVAWLGWRWLFILLIVPGLIMAVLTWLKVTDSPKDYKNITAEEVVEIMGDQVHEEKPTIKEILKRLFKAPVILKLIGVWFCYDMAMVGVSTWLPQYLIKDRGLSIANMAIITVLINVVGIVTPILGGILSDKVFKKNRTILFILSSLLGLPFVYLSFIVQSSLLMTACFLVATFFLATASIAFWAIPMSIVPKEIIGISSTTINVGGQIAGIVTPTLIGAMIMVSGGNYISIAYVLMAGMIAAVLLSLTLFGSKKSKPETVATV